MERQSTGKHWINTLLRMLGIIINHLPTFISIWDSWPKTTNTRCNKHSVIYNHQSWENSRQKDHRVKRSLYRQSITLISMIGRNQRRSKRPRIDNSSVALSVTLPSSPVQIVSGTQLLSNLWLSVTQCWLGKKIGPVAKMTMVTRFSVSRVTQSLVT